MREPAKKTVNPSDVIRDLQARAGTTPSFPTEGSRIGFCFNSKDRVQFTVPTLASIDTDAGFDLIWADGSDTPEGKRLPYESKLKNARLVEIHSDVRGGPDRAICFGLRRLLDLGYDYCGLIENDMVFEPGWFEKLKALFELAAAEGIVCGAATVRGYQSRVLEYRDKYFLCWNVGAGMVLFSRAAAQLILDQYDSLQTTVHSHYMLYARMFGVDLRGTWELKAKAPDRRLGFDWGFSPFLYQHGYASIGSVPSLARDLQFDVVPFLGTRYVSSNHRNSDAALPRVSTIGLQRMYWSGILAGYGWSALKRSPWLYRWVRATARRQMIRQVSGRPQE